MSIKVLSRRLEILGLTYICLQILSFGYPGESDYEFQKTLDFISELNFSDAYSFIYSPRPGTPAAQEIDDLSDKIKSDRFKRIKRFS